MRQGLQAIGWKNIGRCRVVDILQSPLFAEAQKLRICRASDITVAINACGDHRLDGPEADLSRVDARRPDILDRRPERGSMGDPGRLYMQPWVL
jgi:hypothetical protein